MFGYVTINRSSLSDEQYERFRRHYCGLCRTIGERYGLAARSVLSYDMTFLSILLDSLYEPDEFERRLPCPAKFSKRMPLVTSSAAEYAADMNIAFAYFKALDDAEDDSSPAGKLGARALKKHYDRVRGLYPEKCLKIEGCIERLHEMEMRRETQCDPPANLMGDLFGEVYAAYDDFWQEPLRRLGASVGRFIYLLDAFEDLPADLKKGRYNPLEAYKDRPDLDEFIARSLTMIIGEGADAFEMLPLERDKEILKNILYSGIWSRYAAVTEGKNKDRPTKEKHHNE